MSDLHHAVVLTDVIQHRQRVGNIHGHRLFAEDRDSGVHSGTDQLRVGRRTRSNDQTVHTGGQQFGHGWHEVRAQSGSDRPGMFRGHVCELQANVDAPVSERFIEGHHVVGVHDADAPHANQAKSDFFHHFLRG
ncbi:hypothetical protein D3C73_1237090 [compost metagenome]